jgi:segregation and condensation protein A
MAIRTDPVLRPAGDDLWNHAGPELSLETFEGPLALLRHLIGKNQIDIADIPIAAITDQYLSYLSAAARNWIWKLQRISVMAATLLHIKSRLLLPQKLADSQKEAPDPREELVLRLMAYRRCKLLAGDLREQYAIYSRCQTRPPESPAAVGIQLTLEPERLNRDQFWLACQRLCHQNQNRFNDLSGKMATLLRREKVSLHEKMRQIMHAILGKTRVFFHDLFPS